jgi:hypothetical protein
VSVNVHHNWLEQPAGLGATARLNLIGRTCRFRAAKGWPLRNTRGGTVRGADAVIIEAYQP